MKLRIMSSRTNNLPKWSSVYYKNILWSKHIKMANCSKESAKPSPIIHLKSDHVVKTTQKLYLDEETADCYFVFDIDDGKKTENSWRRFLNAYFQTSIFEKWNRTKITQRVPAHKILLATGSEVFKPMFYGGWLEKSEVKIIDVSIEAFTEFLQFFYSNDITISIENVAELMFLAEKYFVDDCLKLCDTVIYEHLPIDDIVSGYELAIKFDRIDLQGKLVAKIGEQAKNVLQSDSFLQCSRIMLKRILEINSLSSVPEDVFDACMIWSKKSCEKKWNRSIVDEKSQKTVRRLFSFDSVLCHEPRTNIELHHNLRWFIRSRRNAGFD